MCGHGDFVLFAPFRSSRAPKAVYCLQLGLGLGLGLGNAPGGPDGATVAGSSESDMDMDSLLVAYLDEMGVPAAAVVQPVASADSAPAAPAGVVDAAAADTGTLPSAENRKRHCDGDITRFMKKPREADAGDALDAASVAPRVQRLYSL